MEERREQNLNEDAGSAENQKQQGRAANSIPLSAWSLIMGVLSFALCGPFTGVPAVILGHKALAKVRAGELSPDQKFLAIAGLALGYFSIALFVLSIVIFAAMFAFVLWTGSLSQCGFQ